MRDDVPHPLHTVLDRLAHDRTLQPHRSIAVCGDGFSSTFAVRTKCLSSFHLVDEPQLVEHLHVLLSSIRSVSYPMGTNEPQVIPVNSGQRSPTQHGCGSGDPRGVSPGAERERLCRPPPGARRSAGRRWQVDAVSALAVKGSAGGGAARASCWAAHRDCGSRQYARRAARRSRAADACRHRHALRPRDSSSPVADRDQSKAR